MSKSIILFAAVMLVASGLSDAKHIYVRYKRAAVEREGDPAAAVPAQESTVIASGNDGTTVHDSVRDFSNEIATNEKGGKDFFEFDYNPQKDLLQFSGSVPRMFRTPQMELVEKMMQAMLAQTQAMFKNFPITTLNNYPDNYNGTTEEEVIIGGRRFRKKERVINKSTGETKLSIVSTVYEPIDEDEIPVASSEGAATTMLPSTASRDGVTEGPVVSY